MFLIIWTLDKKIVIIILIETIITFLNVRTLLTVPDLSFFSNDCCTVHELNSYWPVKYFDENHIFLNGCDGDTYSFVNPGYYPQ